MLVQRVAVASVTVDGVIRGSIGPGFLVFLGAGQGDTFETAAKCAAKVAGLRVFEDAGGKMNLSLAETGGAVLSISQFTLYGDLRRGRRPSFDAAAAPEVAEPLYEAFCAGIEAAGIRCERGVFGAHMEVALVNDGPVTIWLDSEDLEHPRRA